MKKASVLACLASAAMVGCSGGDFDCSDPDVLDTFRGLLAEPVSELMAHSALLGANVSGVVTNERDATVGYYSCRADVAVTTPGGRLVEQELEYEVVQVESGDADFEVSVYRAETRQFAEAVYRAFQQ